jgi:hypothetical protein
MTDFFPSLCRICDVPIPRSIEGRDLSGAWRGQPESFEHDAVLLMNFSAAYDELEDGMDWRGVKTKTHTYARWSNGNIELYDRQADPLEVNNLAQIAGHEDLVAKHEDIMIHLLAQRRDGFGPCSEVSNWYDAQRRVVKNAFGGLSSPETIPDWSLLYP